MDKVGYILLHKQIQDNPLWTDKPFARGQAWIDLLLMANFKDGEMFSKGTMVKVERGQVFRTVGFLSDRWGWSVKKTKGFLKLLENQKMVSIEGLKQGTRITIENYESFQSLGLSTEPSEGLSRDYQRTIEEPSRDYKRIKNNKEKINNNIFVPPSVEEVRSYCKERRNSVNAETFCDFYQSKNWMVGKSKMKDWKAAVRNWERREASKTVPKTIEPPRYPMLEREPEVEGEQMPDYIRERLGGLFG